MKEVLIIYRFLPQYRIEFYNQLKEQLKNENINLTLVYGKSKNEDSLKSDEVDIEWAHYIPSKVFKINKESIYWQPVLTHVKNKDLVIIEQANKLLINYLLLIKRKFHKQKVAFWGHGINMQADRNSLGNLFKRKMTNQVDWWFAYTAGVKKIIENCHFPSERITVVENSIDTVKLINHYKSIDESELERVKKELNIHSANVALYCGGIYKEKRIDFLLEACEIIKSKVTDFEFIIIGGGSEDYKIREFAATNSWVHYVGPKFDNEKVAYFKLSKVFLMPGLVGLAILDTFCTNTPIVTTDNPFHSPEIEYLENGINGVMTRNDVQEYASEVIDIFNDATKFRTLAQGCLESSGYYSTSRMVNNFSEGIKNCLAYPKL